MAETKYLVGKMPDKTMISLINAVEEKYGFDNKEIRYSGFALNDAELLKITSEAGSTYHLTEAFINTKGTVFRLHIQRNPDVVDKLYYDTVTLNHGSSPTPSADQYLEFSELVRSKVRFPNADIPAGGDKKAIALLEREIASLASLHDKMIADTMELRKQLEKEHAERQAELENERLEKEKAINDREAESLAKISAEEQALQAKRADFDFSDHMRARRKQREEISAQVQEFVQAPQSSFATRSKFLALIITIAAVVALSGYFAYMTFAEFLAVSERLVPTASQPAENTVDTTFMLWFLGARGVALTIGSIGFGLYLINLMRRSHDEDLEYQRQLRQYGLDINRASWVIETAMEMTTKEGAALPDKWIEGACRGLFQSPAVKERDAGPIAALGAIMGMAPDITVEGEGKKFDFKSKNVAKAAKEGA